MITNEKPFTTVILEAIQDGIKQEAQRIAEEHKKQMEEELTRSVRDVVAKISVRLMGMVNIETSGNKLVITIYDKTKTD